MQGSKAALARTGARNPDVPGGGGWWGAAPGAAAPHCPAAGRLGGQGCAHGSLRHSPGTRSRLLLGPSSGNGLGYGWPYGFCLQSSGRNSWWQQVGNWKNLRLVNEPKRKEQNLLLPNFPCLALLPNEPLPCQMQDKNVPPHDSTLKKAFTRQKCFTHKICQVNSKET